MRRFTRNILGWELFNHPYNNILIVHNHIITTLCWPVQVMVLHVFILYDRHGGSRGMNLCWIYDLLCMGVRQNLSYLQAEFGFSNLPCAPSWLYSLLLKGLIYICNHYSWCCVARRPVHKHKSAVYILFSVPNWDKWEYYVMLEL